MSVNKHDRRFVWHDMMSTDAEVSKAFYTGLFGWRIEVHDMGMGPYAMLHAGDQAIGGIVGMDPAMAPGVPSHWVAYVDVDDIQACVDRGAAAGGKTLMPPMEIPSVGKFAMLGDTGEAVFAAFQDGADRERPDLPEVASVGTFAWDELHTQDPARSQAYYSAVFGWTYREMDMGPAGIYHLIVGPGGKDLGGMMQAGPEAGGHEAWLSYVHVEDVDAANTKAEGLGGKTMVPPSDIPGMGRFSVMTDPNGAMFALYVGAQAPG